jgi:hypothetical protein
MEEPAVLLSLRTPFHQDNLLLLVGQKEIPGKGVLSLLLWKVNEEFDAPWNPIAFESGAQEQNCGKCEQAARECLSVWVMEVQVVKAKAHGEAYCALLDLRGVVDVDISNNGNDCLLSEAKVV